MKLFLSSTPRLAEANSAVKGIRVGTGTRMEPETIGGRRHTRAGKCISAVGTGRTVPSAPFVRRHGWHVRHTLTIGRVVKLPNNALAEPATYDYYKIYFV